ncbi:hypothetical protein BU17DRAFT_80435 [Hysterangium stoloniferum]|nr:hypothetical protein BU17DRAFT_80435 [Hysterangium stoloniferum]
MSATLHKLLFTLIALVSLAEIAVTAILFAKDTQAHHFTSRRYHDLLIVFLADSAWTSFFGVMYAYWILTQAYHFFASIAISMWWLCITAILWGVTAGLFHNSRTGGICDGLAPLSRCRQSLTVEALGWTEFALCIFTIISTWIWVSQEASDVGSWRGSWYDSQAREPHRGVTQV